MSDQKRRKPTQPWKGIYGKDRKYTARVDRLKERSTAPTARSGHLQSSNGRLITDRRGFSDQAMPDPPPVTSRIGDTIA